MKTIKKRLILKDDINFDLAGNDDLVSFYDEFGNVYTSKKINAGDIPLKKNTRTELAAADVDAALLMINNKANSIFNSSILEKDTDVVFTNEDTSETIQFAINKISKNLNGHTVRFLFPAALSQILLSAITWEGFFNGKIYIGSAQTDSKISIYDSFDIGGLFFIKRCLCEVVLKDFNFIHEYSQYAICAENSPAVWIKDCAFFGQTNQTTFALKLDLAMATLEASVLENDLPWRGKNMYFSGSQITDTTAFTRDTDNSFLGIYGGSDIKNSGSIELFGGEHDTAPGGVNITAPGGVNITASGGVKVENKNIIRSINGRTADAEGEIDGFFAPDWSSAVARTKDTSYTCETNGFLLLSVCLTKSGGGALNLTINGHEIKVRTNNTAWGYLFIPVNKGDVYKFTISYADVYNVYFYKAL